MPDDDVERATMYSLRSQLFSIVWACFLVLIAVGLFTGASDFVVNTLIIGVWVALALYIWNYTMAEKEVAHLEAKS